MAEMITRKALWQRYLAAGMIAVAAYTLLPSGGLAQGLVFVGIHVSALAAILAGIRVHRPKFATAWWVILVGQGFYAVANVIWYPYVVGFDVELTFPSVADAIYVPAYATVLVGIVMLMWRRGARDRASVIDAAIVTIGTGGLSWVFLMRPHFEDPAVSAPVKAIAIAYPVIDLLLLGAVMLVAFVRSARSRPYWLLSLGLALTLVADTAYALSSLNGTFSYGDPYFLGWMAFYVLFGTTALHPSMGELSEPAAEPEPVLTRPRLAFLAAAALIPPVTMVVDESINSARDQTFLAVLCAVLFSLVLARVSGLMSDISQRKRMEKAKDEFISVVSHELRTPLTSIRGALGLLASGAMGELPVKGKRMLEIAASNTDRLVRLINDILDIERMESGQAPLQRRTCNAGDLVRQAVEAMCSMADEAKVTLSASTQNVQLFADPDRIVQTLMNLLNNAVKFSPSNGTVHIADERRDGEVLFTVSDQGRGIPADKVEFVFGRFQQVDASDSRDKGGSGLGLAICRSIVNQHGGRIWVDSTPGRGSTFSFTLPALPEHQQAEPEGASSRSGPFSVLVCDDDPDVLEAVSAMLERHGYAVIRTTSGGEALEAAAVHHPAAILLDLVMPGMSGCDTIAALKQEPRTADIPVVALTVMEKQDEELSRVDEWVSKPIEEATLFAALRRALSKHGGAADVLVVEDDVGLAQVFSAMFEQHGLRSFHAQTVRQAVEMCRHLLPDLLVLDLMLPDGDGAEIVDFLREDDRLRTVPVVVYTAKDLDEAERGQLQLGQTHFFTKGRVTPAELELRVTALLERMVKHREKEHAPL